MKKYFFIDFDSVKKLSIKKESFDCKSYIYIFYTKSIHAKNIDLDILQIINKYAKKVEFISVPDEKHLLGKYLCGKLGMLLGNNGVNSNNQYVIVSPKDSYDAFVKYIRNEGHTIERKNNINIEINTNSKSKTEKAKETKAAEKNKTAPIAKKQTKAANKKEVKTETEEKTGVLIQEKKYSEKPKQENIKNTKNEPNEQSKPTPKKETKAEIPEVKEETKAEEKIPEKIVEIKQDVVDEKAQEEKIEEAKQPASPYEPLINKIHHELTIHKNDNGNKYSSKVKKDVAKLVADELAQNADLETIYTKLKDRYVVTYSGIYNLIRKCVLKFYPETKDYIEIAEVKTVETKQENVQETITPQETKVKETGADDIHETPKIIPVVEVESDDEIQEQPVSGAKEAPDLENVEEIPASDSKEEQTAIVEKTSEIQNDFNENTDEYQTIRNAIGDLVETSEQEEAVIHVIEESRSLPANKQKQYIYTSLSRLFGRTHGSAIHRVIKPLL